MTWIYIGLGLLVLAALSVFACPIEPSCPEANSCPTIVAGTVQRVRGDTLFVITGVGHALRLDTVVVKPGQVIWLSDCGH